MGKVKVRVSVVGSTDHAKECFNEMLATEIKRGTIYEADVRYDSGVSNDVGRGRS